MKKSLWSKKADEMTFGDSVKGMIIVYAIIIAFAAMFNLVMDLESIPEKVSALGRKIKNFFRKN